MLLFLELEAGAALLFRLPGVEAAKLTRRAVGDFCENLCFGGGIFDVRGVGVVDLAMFIERKGFGSGPMGES